MSDRLLPAEGAATPATAEAREALQTARRQVGAPYRYGADGPRAFDCSGLVHYAYHQAGVSVPRTVADLRRTTFPVRATRLRPGDLVFFRFKGKVGHVGLYAGDGRFVHAPSSGEEVTYASLRDSFWRQRLVRAGRFF